MPNPLILATDGNIYGTTEAGGAYNQGTVFKITPTGRFDTLYNFCSQPNCTDGASPLSGLMQSTNGNLYGTTYYGGATIGGCYGYGCGTVFEINAAGKFTSLYSFCTQLNCADGDLPAAALIEGRDGNLYGNTEEGGATSSQFGGTIFKITQNGRLTTLYSFCSQPSCFDGTGPRTQLVQALDGNFYGTTYEGGIDGDDGTAFKITPEGNLTTLYDFCSQTGCLDGFQPDSGLTQATDGNFYGTTSGGGKNVAGIVFQLTSSGTLTVLYNFCSEANCTDGGVPTGNLLQGTDGTLYGTTIQAGTGDCNNGRFVRLGCGTVFGFSMDLAPFATFVLNAARVGQPSEILGQGFTGTTSVSLNGTPASFTVVSDTFIKATVPAGATTGYVTVTTPSGTLTSNVPFYVLP